MGLTYTSEHARSSSAHLQVEFAHLRSVEHRVKTGDFIHLHGGHVEDLGSFVHSGEGQEVVVLLLSDEQDGDHCRRLIVWRVLGLEKLNCGVSLLRELEGGLFKVVLGVSMVGESREGHALRNAHHGSPLHLSGLSKNQLVHHL